MSSWAENTSKFRTNVIQSDADLRKLQPSERSCYFEDERKLRFFKVYTRQNCKIRYFSNFSREACNCVSFDLVRDPDTRVCGITVSDDLCLYRFKAEIRDYRPGGMLDSCPCLPLCDSVSYDTAIKESNLKESE